MRGLHTSESEPVILSTTLFYLGMDVKKKLYREWLADNPAYGKSSQKSFCSQKSDFDIPKATEIIH